MPDISSKVRVARRAYFSSAVRLAVPGRTREENIALYGSQYSDYGHGHNFILEAHLIGKPDPRTGMVMAMAELDAILRQVTSLLDHRHLNHDISEFKDVVPTTENIAVFCYDRLSAKLKEHPVYLEKVRLFENDECWVDFGKNLAPDIV